MKHKYHLISYVLLGISVVLLLLIAYTFLSNNSAAQPKPIHVSSQVNCSFSDKTFCNTEVKVRSYVTTGDFSDVLENEIPTYVTCSGNAAVQTYCSGIKSGLIIQVFQIKQNGVIQLATRNQYVNYFSGVIEDFGSLNYVSTGKNGSNVKMTFLNSTKTYQITLTFEKVSGMWKILYPATSAI